MGAVIVCAAVAGDAVGGDGDVVGAAVDLAAVAAVADAGADVDGVVGCDAGVYYCGRCAGN